MANPFPGSFASGNESGGSTCTPGAPQLPQMPQMPQMALLEFFFPGFSMFAGAAQKYLHIDLSLYVHVLLFAGALTVAWNYMSSYMWDQLETYFMSVVDIRTDDEIYNILMAWVANQKFSQRARRFVVNTKLSSRNQYVWVWDYSDDDDEDGESEKAKKKPLSYTPAFGSHYFWYRGRLLLFRRTANREQTAALLISEREEISLSCFGRNPWILKELLMEAQQVYNAKDEHKTLIYRGTLRPGSTDPSWQRCMARVTRPFSTVILNEKTKQDLIDDVTDYLDPATQRWYSNRGIPYRRGYLLHGPPGTGKSSLSLALAGFFKLRIYIVSLSSMLANEEGLASLFSELPRRCVVLLEDIDTAGLTHTREDNQAQSQDVPKDEPDTANNEPATTTSNEQTGRLSLSGLLNILDGVASQEGRVLIMTTNHIEKLDRALIRPGRVDMIVKFGLADEDMTASIFRAILGRLDDDEETNATNMLTLDPEARQRAEKEAAKQRAAEEARINSQAAEFASKIPAHEFSPAELQGYLMKHKRDPQAAIANVDDFIVQARKDRKQKDLEEAEEKRKAEAKIKKENNDKKEAEKAQEKTEDKEVKSPEAAEAETTSTETTVT